MNLNNDTMDKLANAIITLKYREIPYILDEKQEKYKKRMYDFIILKKDKDIFTTILKLIPLYYEVGEDNNYIHVFVFIPFYDNSDYTQIIDFLRNFCSRNFTDFYIE